MNEDKKTTRVVRRRFETQQETAPELSFEIARLPPRQWRELESSIFPDVGDIRFWNIRNFDPQSAIWHHFTGASFRPDGPLVSARTTPHGYVLGIYFESVWIECPETKVRIKDFLSAHQMDIFLSPEGVIEEVTVKTFWRVHYRNGCYELEKDSNLKLKPPVTSTSLKTFCDMHFYLGKAEELPTSKWFIWTLVPEIANDVLEALREVRRNGVRIEFQHLPETAFDVFEKEMKPSPPETPGIVNLPSGPWSVIKFRLFNYYPEGESFQGMKGNFGLLKIVLCEIDDWSRQMNHLNRDGTNGPQQQESEEDYRKIRIDPLSRTYLRWNSEGSPYILAMDIGIRPLPGQQVEKTFITLEFHINESGGLVNLKRDSLSARNVMEKMPEADRTYLAEKCTEFLDYVLQKTIAQRIKSHERRSR